jgi:hypothetical protein
VFEGEIGRVFDPTEDGGWSALAPDLPGLLIAGDTREELLANLPRRAQPADGRPRRPLGFRGRPERLARDASAHPLSDQSEIQFDVGACRRHVDESLRDVREVGDGRIDMQVPARCGLESMDVGMDCVSPVCDDYAHLGTFPFTGTIDSVTLTIGEGHHPSGLERIELANKMD